MILFFDIDGTLLDYQGRMPDSTRQALEMAKAKGHKLILCSGRSRCGVEQLLERFGFDGVVCSAGAYVEYRGRIINHEVLSEKEKQKMIAFFEKTQSIYGLQTKEHIVCPMNMLDAFESSFGEPFGKNDTEDNEKEDKLDEISKTFIFVEDIYSVKNVEKGFYYGANVGLREALEMLKPEFEVRTASYNMPDPNNGEISLNGITKSYGMQKLLDYLDSEKSEVIAFGDGFNDFEMLDFSGVGVAMGNACKELKEKADYVTDSVERDGIMKAMKYWKLI